MQKFFGPSNLNIIFKENFFESKIIKFIYLANPFLKYDKVSINKYIKLDLSANTIVIKVKKIY